jgi:trimethylamine--corrinoid protein Co-methyltransferase
MASVVMSDMLLGAGLLHGSRIWSYSQMLMDCEIFSIIHKMMQGITVDDESLALDVIRKVGPGGNFLSQKHTLKHMRELFTPQFMDRRPYNVWEEKKDDGRDWALEKARKILTTHQPEALAKVAPPARRHSLPRSKLTMVAAISSAARPRMAVWRRLVFR